MSRDQQELMLRVRDLERDAMITDRVLPAGPSLSWAYQVTIRKVGATRHVFLAAGRRTAIGGDAQVDEAQDLGAYVAGAKVYITRTHPTVTEAGLWGAWKYDSDMPDEDETQSVYYIAETTGGRPIHHHFGDIRHFDIRRYRTCQG